MITITLPRATVEQALEALGLAKLNGKSGLHPAEIGEIADAITALRAALTQQAEPVEPVAWSGYDLDGMVEAFSRVIEAHYQRANPFQNPVDMDAQMALRILRGFIPAMQAYTSPPQRPPQQAEPAHLTGLSIRAQSTIGRWLNEDMDRAVANGANSISMPDELVEIAAWLHAQAEPVEPYCHVYEYDGVFGLHREFYPLSYNGIKPSRTVPVYTAPPQRKPLTEEEIMDAFHAARNAKLGASQDNSKHRLSVVEIARAVERAHGIGGSNG